MKLFSGKIKRPLVVSQNQKPVEQTMDEFVALFSETWEVLVMLTDKYGEHFSDEDTDRLLVLDMQLNMVKDSVIKVNNA